MKIVLIEILESRRLLSLDSHWQQTDVGVTGLAGDATSSQVTRANLAFNVTGSGDGLTSAADSFHFVYQTLWGNGRIMASVSNDTAADAGVMIRESLLPGARMVSVGLNGAGSALFSNRLITDDPGSSGPFQTNKPFQWVKIVRAGNTFTSYVSTNRNSWKRTSVIQIPMTVNVLVGLAVTSDDPTLLDSATLDNVQVVSQKPSTKLAGWRTVAAAPLGLYESASATVNGKLYVFGGFYSEQTQATAQSDVYDPATDTWTRIADMPFVVTHSGVAVVGTDVYFAGGFLGDWFGPSGTDQTDQVIKYDTLTDTWSNIAPLPASRAAGGLVLIGQQLHFFGGTDEFVQHDMSDQWVYDLTNPAAGWVSKAPMPDPRDHFGYTVLNGMIYAVGGEHLTDETQGNDSEVDQYNPATDTWTQVAPLPLALSHIHTNTLVINNRIVIFGGSANGDTAPTFLANISSYNPKRNRWTALAPLPEPRSATVVRMVGNQIITTGGENNFLPQTTTWAMDASVFARQLH
jgi:N-acetylneuraminic acid mutarotase